MITNRPLPPVQIYRAGLLPAAFPSYDYFSDNFSHSDTIDETYHGMIKRYARQADDWEETLKITGQSGMCSFLALAVANNTGQNKLIGFRVKVDGNYAINEERINIVNTGQRGVVFIGHMLFSHFREKPTAVMRGYASFDQSLIVETFTDNISQLSIVVAARLFWTY